MVVPKPDGGIRLCVDFRKGNTIFSFDAFPMPNIEETMEKIEQAEFISTLSPTKGYWQFPMTLEAKVKTAFGTPWGLYQFTHMPFGLHGMASLFQYLMDRILATQQEYAAAYIDGIVIYLGTWEQHVLHVREILEELR